MVSKVLPNSVSGKLGLEFQGVVTGWSYKMCFLSLHSASI